MEGKLCTATLPESPPGCPRGWAILEPGVNEKILNQKSSPVTLVFVQRHSAGAGPGLSHKCLQPLKLRIKGCNAQLQGCWGTPGQLSLTQACAFTFCSHSKALPSSWVPGWGQRFQHRHCPLFYFFSAKEFNEKRYV